MEGGHGGHGESVRDASAEPAAGENAPDDDDRDPDLAEEVALEVEDAKEDASVLSGPPRWVCYRHCWRRVHPRTIQRHFESDWDYVGGENWLSAAEWKIPSVRMQPVNGTLRMSKTKTKRIDAERAARHVEYEQELAACGKATAKPKFRTWFSGTELRYLTKTRAVAAEKRLAPRQVALPKKLRTYAHISFLRVRWFRSLVVFCRVRVQMDENKHFLSSRSKLTQLCKQTMISVLEPRTCFKTLAAMTMAPTPTRRKKPRPPPSAGVCAAPAVAVAVRFRPFQKKDSRLCITCREEFCNGKPRTTL